MKTLNIHEAKTHLSRLVEEALAGEDIVIARAGKPLVRLVAVSATTGPRKLGALAGKIIERADAWEPDSEVEALFYGGEIEPPRAKRVAKASRKQSTSSRRKKK
jgi:prevent-host-death family protein